MGLNLSKNLVVFGVVLLSFAWNLFLLIGVGLFVLANSGSWPLPVGIRNDQVFGRFIVEKLPVGVIGLVIAAVLAAAMSTLSSSLNSSASAAIADFYKPLCPNLTDGKYLAVSRLLTILFGLAQISVALIAWQIDSPRSIVDQVLSIAGLTTGMVLGLFLLGTMSIPVSSVAALIGMVLGFIAVLTVYIPATLGNAVVAWPFYAPIGTITTVLTALLVNPFMISKKVL
jgi:Na+/proline symporter